jgi:flavodoxin
MHMNVLVTYVTQSGNTKKVAEAMYSSIEADKQIMPLKEVRDLEGCGLVFIGFPIVQMGPAKEAVEFLNKHAAGRKVALFATHAAPEESPHLEKWLAPAREAASQAMVMGIFSCRGELAQTVKEAMLKSGNPQLVAWANGDDSQGQPDETQLERARGFAREIIESQSE